MAMLSSTNAPSSPLQERATIRSKDGSPRKARRFLLAIMTFLTLAIGCFFVENHAYFNAGTRVAMNDTEFWLSYFGTVLMFIAYLIAAKRFAQAKVHWIVVAFVALFAIDGLLGVTLYPGYMKGGQIVYLASVTEDFRFLASLSVEVFGVYLVYAVVPQVIRGNTSFRILMEIYIVILCVAIGWSYWKEFDLYKYMFDNGTVDKIPAFPKSWTTNRNVYGMMLFMGIACEGYLLSYRPRWWRYVSIVFFASNLLFIVSKTPLFVTLLFVPAFYIYRFIVTLKKHWLRNVIILGVLLVLAGTITALTLSGFFAERLPKVDSFFHSFVQQVLESSDNSFQVRVQIWAKIYADMKNNVTTMIFGYGDYNHSNVINQIFGVTDPNGYYPCDSSYMTILAKFGYFGIVLYAGLLAYLFFYIILAIIHHSKAWYYYLLMFICIGAISVTEAHPLLGLSSQSMMLFLVLVLPLLNDAYLSKHPEAQEAGVPQVLPPYQAIGNYDVTRLSFFITTPLMMALFPLALYASSVWAPTGYSSIMNLVSLSVVFVFLPYLIGGLVSLIQKKNFFFILYAAILVLYLALAGLSPLIPYGDILLGVNWLLLIVLIVLLHVFKVHLMFGDTLEVGWLYIGLYLASLALSLILFLIPSIPHTPYLMVCLMGLALVLWLFFFVSLPHEKDADWFLLRNEDGFENWVNKVFAWWDHRNQAYWDKEKGPKIKKDSKKITPPTKKDEPDILIV